MNKFYLFRFLRVCIFGYSKFKQNEDEVGNLRTATLACVRRQNFEIYTKTTKN